MCGAGKSRENNLAAITAITVFTALAAIVVTKIDAGVVAPSEARSAMTPEGSTATPLVLIARKSTIALVAVPFVLLSASSSCIALMPNGVAALPRPSTLAAMFMIIAPMAGWSAGTSGKSRTITGRIIRASTSRPPAASSTFMSPRNSVIAPARLMARSTLPFAPSSAALPTAAIVPGSPNAAATTDTSTSPKKTMFMVRRL